MPTVMGLGGCYGPWLVSLLDPVANQKTALGPLGPHTL